jgi:C_GCAxxG_C_C family probable redox protein
MNTNNKAECAITYFKNDYCCSQAVFATFAPELGLERETALKIASSFCAGMGKTGRTCGAVTGAFMVIGLGRGSAEPDQKSREEAYRLVQEFVRLFNERNTTIECKELLGCDIGTPDGYREAQAKNLFETVCEKLVRDAVEIVEGLLADRS